MPPDKTWTFSGWYICGIENLITSFQIMCFTFCFEDFVPWWIANTLFNTEFQNEYFEKSYYSCNIFMRGGTTPGSHLCWFKRTVHHTTTQSVCGLLERKNKKKNIFACNNCWIRPVHLRPRFRGIGPLSTPDLPVFCFGNLRFFLLDHCFKLLSLLWDFFIFLLIPIINFQTFRIFDFSLTRVTAVQERATVGHDGWQ